VAALPILALAIYLVIQQLPAKDPELKQDSISMKPENKVVVNKEESSTANDSVTVDTIMSRLKSNTATEKVLKTSDSLEIIENGQPLSEIIRRIGEPQGLFELKVSDKIILYYAGDLKIELINGKVVNLPSDFNEKLKRAMQEKEQTGAPQSGKWKAIQKTGQLMKAKIRSLLTIFKKSET